MWSAAVLLPARPVRRIPCWMNLVECWFSLAERQAIHRGTYTSVKDLNAKIRAYIDGWNDRSHPFTWTRPPTRACPVDRVAPCGARS